MNQSEKMYTSAFWDCWRRTSTIYSMDFLLGRVIRMTRNVYPSSINIIKQNIYLVKHYILISGGERLYYESSLTLLQHRYSSVAGGTLKCEYNQVYHNYLRLVCFHIHKAHSTFSSSTYWWAFHFKFYIVCKYICAWFVSWPSWQKLCCSIFRRLKSQLWRNWLTNIRIFWKINVMIINDQTWEIECEEFNTQAGVKKTSNLAVCGTLKCEITLYVKR